MVTVNNQSQEFLESPDLSGDFSLYFHIPFCTRKCDYCHFYVIPENESHKDLLMVGFQKEWERLRSLTKNKTLKTIYFGGGTPSLLGPERINKLLSLLNPNPQIEITLEANPENITVKLMRSYKAAGINRVSIGIQTFDNQMLKRLGRLHNAQRAQDAVQLTHDAGITNISVDLMYDLPGQDLNMWINTLSEVKKLPITHLSLYNLTIEPHTLFFKQRKILEKTLPDEETSLRMYEAAISNLEEMGLKQYEISAFARDMNYSRHNVGYWTGRPFLGLGPSAFSYWENKRYRNIANLHKYCAQAEKSAVDFEEELDQGARLRELLTIRLRLVEGVNLEEFQKDHGKLDDMTMKVIERLRNEGYVTGTGARLKMTKRGVLFYDTLAVELI